MPAPATQSPTEALEISRSLPEGCLAYRNGLVVPKGIDFEAWKKIGTTVGRLSGSVMWMLGDWLAYGETNFFTKKSNSGESNRVPMEVYEKIGTLTGFSSGALANAKSVCARLPFSRRRENLTYSHALEIVSLAPEKQFGLWIDRVQAGGISTKALREELRKASSTHKPEAHDGGTLTFLEIARQFSRDYLTACPTWTPAYRAEVLKILTPVLSEMGVRG